MDRICNFGKSTGRFKKVVNATTLFLVVVAAGCKIPTAKFGIEFNHRRQMIGLPLLPENWKAWTIVDDFTMWVNPDRENVLNLNQPVWFSKTVGYDSEDQIISEDDHYYSGKTFNTIDGKSRESLSVIYYFKPTKIVSAEISGWYCQYIGPDEWPKSNSTNNDTTSNFSNASFTIDQADSILKTWKLGVPKRSRR